MKALFCSLVFLCSMGAYAGLPSEDSYIKDLRSRFQNAQKPLEDDLYELVFSCEGRNAMKGDFNSDFIKAQTIVISDSSVDISSPEILRS